MYDDEHLGTLRTETLKQMPYLKAPEAIWIQRDGKYLSISEMELDHMKNSIKAIERDIKYLKTRPSPIKNEFLGTAEDKLKELKSTFNRNIQF